jgi:hypothetical protein
MADQVMVFAGRGVHDLLARRIGDAHQAGDARGAVTLPR